MAPRILMGCANYWTSPFQVGSHHIARECVELGLDVGFISDPITPLHFARGWTNDLRERWRLYRNGGQRFLQKRLWAYVPGAVFPAANVPLLRSAWVHRHWWRFTWPKLTGAIKRNGFDNVAYLYLDNPKQHFLLRAVRARRTIYRMADFNPGFHHVSPALAELEKAICRDVDVVIYTAQPLADYVRSLQPRRAVYVPNGVRFRHFQEPQPLPEEYARLPRPIAVYVGAIDFWFDFELLEQTARELPHVSFVLIGPCDKLPLALTQLPNLHALGRRSHEQLPAYLQHADVGLIPFRTRDRCAELVRCINPLKLHEYMACGLPVVATDWEELRLLGSPARLCRSPEEFVRELEGVLSAAPEQAVYRQFAARTDWRQRTEEMLHAAA